MFESFKILKFYKEFKVVWKKTNISQNKDLKEPKMAQSLKFKMLFAFKWNLNGGPFYWKTSKFGHFKNLQIILKNAIFF